MTNYPKPEHNGQPLTTMPQHWHRVCDWATATRNGTLSRREFMALASTFGVAAAASHAMLGLAAPHAHAAHGGTPVMGGTLRVAMNVRRVEDPRNFDWSEMGNVARQFCEPLVQWESDFSFAPKLLESWDVNADGTVFTLNLRRGVKWNNGDRFTAEDVAYNVTRWCETEVPGNSMSTRMGSLIDPATGLASKGAITIVDDYTVVLKTNKPDITIIAGMVDYPGLIVHRDFEKNGGNLTEAPIGTGPFELVKVDIGVSAEVKVRESGWWGGRAPLDRIVWTDYGTDPAALIAAFESDEIDVNYETPPGYIEILDNFDLVNSSIDTASTVTLRCNVKHPPYDKQKVRRAIQLSADNDTLLQLGYNDRGIKANNIHVGPMHPEYYLLPPVKRDIKAAKALMEEAGEIDFTHELISIDDGYRRDTADALAEQMRGAGFKVERTVIAGSSFWNNWTQYPFSITNWNPRPLGIQMYGLGYKTGVPWNETAFSDPEFDALLEDASGVADVAKRSLLMGKLEIILLQSGVIVQPYWRSITCHHTHKLHNYQMNQAFEMHFDKSYLSDA